MCCCMSEITSGAKRREVILTYNSSDRAYWQYKKNEKGRPKSPRD